MSIKPIRLKEKEAIIQSLKSGVTPKIGLQHIQVGRSKEISALNKDIDRVIEGGSTFRLIIGEYGSGKTFFLSVVRSIALEKKLVTLHADLSPDRRIHASGGQARNLYSELIRNMATRNKPDGNALTSVVERFITEARKEADNTNIAVSTVIQNKLFSLADLVGGYDFAKVIEAYWIAHEQDNELLRNILKISYQSFRLNFRQIVQQSVVIFGQTQFSFLYLSKFDQCSIPTKPFLWNNKQSSIGKRINRIIISNILNQILEMKRNIPLFYLHIKVKPIIY